METNFQPLEFPRSGSKEKDGGEKRVAGSIKFQSNFESLGYLFLDLVGGVWGDQFLSSG